MKKSVDKELASNFLKKIKVSVLMQLNFYENVTAMNVYQKNEVLSGTKLLARVVKQSVMKLVSEGHHP